MTTSEEQNLDDEYRPVSRLAVAALISGIASLTVFAGPPITVVMPLAAVVTSVAALRYLQKNEQLAGRRLALIGLALAVASLLGGPAWWGIRAWQMRRLAASVAESWIDSVQNGDFRRAHQLTLVAPRRFPNTTPLAESYAGVPPAQGALNTFSDEKAVREIRALGESKVHLIAIEEHRSGRAKHWFGLEYEVTPASGESRTLRIVVEHVESTPAGDSWHIAGFGFGEAPESP